MGSLFRRCVTALAIASMAALCSGGSAQAVGFEPIPLSVAADGVGHVYVSSPLTSSAVQQYTSDGTLLANLGEFAVSSNPFFPRGITTDAAGDLYVDDGEGETISVLGADGGTLRHWTARQGRDLAVGPDGSVYMAGPREILRFSSGGTLLAKWGGGGGQFGEVWGIDTSPTGLVYVADTYGNQIEVFTADGTFVRKWGRYGKGNGQFIYPYGIAVSASGEVYVADTVNARIERFSPTGEFLGAWGGPGRGHGRFHTPTSVATDPAGNVYVADMAEPYPGEGHARVQKFTADGQFVTQWYDGPPPRLIPGPPRLFASVGRRTRKRFATFHFHSRLKGVTYACRLSGELVPPKLRKWSACTSPKRYTHLRPGRKVFHVRAVKGSSTGYEARHSWLILG